MRKESLVTPQVVAAERGAATGTRVTVDCDVGKILRGSAQPEFGDDSRCGLPIAELAGGKVLRCDEVHLACKKAQQAVALVDAREYDGGVLIPVAREEVVAK
jgi:hypothetical protein